MKQANMKHGRNIKAVYSSHTLTISSHFQFLKATVKKLSSGSSNFALQHFDIWLYGNAISAVCPSGCLLSNQKPCIKLFSAEDENESSR